MTPVSAGSATGLTEAAGLLDPAAAAADHTAIAEAIAAEDGDRARRLAERHVELTLHRLTAMRLALPQRSQPPAAGGEERGRG